jgi:hypothetical protein
MDLKSGQPVHPNKRKPECGGNDMKWIYWSRLYDSKFQAGCLVQRMEHDGWVFGIDMPQEIEVFRSRKGRYGVRYMP